MNEACGEFGNRNVWAEEAFKQPKPLKKLFISCPMAGINTEDIKANMEKMHNIAEIYVGELLEVVNPYRCMGDGDTLLSRLAEAIRLMEEADYFIACDKRK